MASLSNYPLGALVARELTAFRTARKASDAAAAWRFLERAHIIAQAGLAQHTRVHFEMLRFAFDQRDAREALGQLLRLLLVPIGNATGRLPVGNTGRSNVSAFASMSIPPDLAAELGKESVAKPCQE